MSATEADAKPLAQASYADILRVVSQWPADQRFMLTQDLLQTLAPPPTGPAIQSPLERKKTLHEALGLLKTDGPPPTDEEVERILDEARWERYGR